MSPGWVEVGGRWQVGLLTVFIVIYMQRKEHSLFKGIVYFNPFSLFLFFFKLVLSREIQFNSDQTWVTREWISQRCFCFPCVKI